MKKIVALLILICIAMSGLIYKYSQNMDNEGPIISETQDIVYKEEMTTAELLQGMSALDEKDGDVSDSLIVESVFKSDENNVAIIYVAKDKNNNISKYRRELQQDNRNPLSQTHKNMR